jgi:hypothetical protein
MASLVLLNFGTYAETNRFKAKALAGGVLAADAMDDNRPGPLVVADGVREKRQVAGVDVVSYYGLSGRVWRAKLGAGTFADAFRDWMNKVLSKPATCVYLTGHHWDDHKRARYTILSWGEDTDHFHAKFDREKQQLFFGVGEKLVEVDTTKLRSGCRLVLGFGCNVATAINSKKYQTFFGDPPPILLGWDQSVSVPPAHGPSVNDRFFKYLKDFAEASGKVPTTDRLQWFYDHEPMEIVRAWGHATIPWLSSQSRARDQTGTLCCFDVDKKADTARPKKC